MIKHTQLKGKYYQKEQQENSSSIKYIQWEATVKNDGRAVDFGRIKPDVFK